MSKEIDVNKTNESRSCIICNYYSKYCFFIKLNSRFQSKACDGCHELMQKTMSFNDAAIFFDSGNNYRIHFWYMSKDEAINIMKSSDFKK